MRVRHSFAGRGGIRDNPARIGFPPFSKIKYRRSWQCLLKYGEFLNVLIAFVLIAATLYFQVVVPVNTLMAGFTPSLLSRQKRSCARSVLAIYLWPQSAALIVPNLWLRFAAWE